MAFLKTLSIVFYGSIPFLTLSLIRNTDSCSLSLVPPIVVLMVNATPIVKKYSLQSLQLITIGAAPLTKESQSRLKSLLPTHTTVNQVWGMTESSCVATVSSLNSNLQYNLLFNPCHFHPQPRINYLKE